MDRNRVEKIPKFSAKGYNHKWMPKFPNILQISIREPWLDVFNTVLPIVYFGIIVWIIFQAISSKNGMILFTLFFLIIPGVLFSGLIKWANMWKMTIDFDKDNLECGEFLIPIDTIIGFQMIQNLSETRYGLRETYGVILFTEKGIFNLALLNWMNRTKESAFHFAIYFQQFFSIITGKSMQLNTDYILIKPQNSISISDQRI